MSEVYFDDAAFPMNESFVIACFAKRAAQRLEALRPGGYSDSQTWRRL